MRLTERTRKFIQSTDKVRAERSVIHSEDDVGGRARVTRDEERVSECCEEVGQRRGDGDMEVG